MKVLELTNIELTYPQSRFEIKKKMKPSKIGPISLDFFDSEVVGIIGRNGSGKSTLLRLAGGVYPPDKGEIKIAGSISRSNFNFRLICFQKILEFLRLFNADN